MDSMKWMNEYRADPPPPLHVHSRPIGLLSLNNPCMTYFLIWFIPNLPKSNSYRNENYTHLLELCQYYLQAHTSFQGHSYRARF